MKVIDKLKELLNKENESGLDPEVVKELSDIVNDTSLPWDTLENTDMSEVDSENSGGGDSAPLAPWER